MLLNKMLSMFLLHFLISCVQLSRKAHLGKKTIKPIKLPSHHMKLKQNKKCSVAGWGYMKTDGQTVDELQVVDVPIIIQEDCRKMWRKLPAEVICTGGYPKNKGFCKVCFLCVNTKCQLASGLKMA